MTTADCEEWGSGLLGQPVAAATSLAYVLAGLVVVWLVARGRWSRSFAWFGAAVAVEGVGSVAFHGEGGDVAQVLHDAPLLGMLGFVAGWHVARVIAPIDPSRAGLGGVVGLWIGVAVGAGAALVGAPATFSAVPVVVIVAAELVARRRGATPVWTPSLLVLLGVAGVSWWLGSTGSPLCDPSSVAQPHGSWHVVSAVVAVTWVDRAAIALDPIGAPRVWRRAIDWAVAWLARGLEYAFYRSVDVLGRERIPWGRPMLVVANHANGFVDPILVAAAMGRLPRFMAKAALWKVAVARPLLAFAGVLPIHRRADGDDVTSNVSVFAACHAEHQRGGIVAIFPEGTTGDRGGLDRVRSGAARIAIGSLPAAPELVVVPVGLAFESRVETRGRALVEFGEPLVPSSSDVGVLTEEIRVALQAISPGYESVDERDVFRAAARVRLELVDHDRARRFGDIELVGRRIAAAPRDRREAVVGAYQRYAARLQIVGLRDRQLQPGASSWRRLAVAALAVVALGSIVATAALLHLPAIILVWASTAAVGSTSTKGTVRILVGLAAGIATWVTFGVVVGDGWGSLVAGVTLAVEGAVALAVFAPLLRWADELWGRIRMRDRAGLMPQVLADRAALGRAVDDAVSAR